MVNLLLKFSIEYCLEQTKIRDIFVVLMAFAACEESATQYKKSTQFRDYYKQACNGYIPHLMHTYDHVSSHLDILKLTT